VPFIMASVVLFVWAFPRCCLSVFSQPSNMLSTQAIIGSKNEYEFRCRLSHFHLSIVLGINPGSPMVHVWSV
jgi:hypothetical protein